MGPFRCLWAPRPQGRSAMSKSQAAELKATQPTLLRHKTLHGQ